MPTTLTDHDLDLITGGNSTGAVPASGAGGAVKLSNAEVSARLTQVQQHFRDAARGNGGQMMQPNTLLPPNSPMIMMPLSRR